jgi:energy-coupling factor transport system permease protein
MPEKRTWRLNEIVTLVVLSFGIGVAFWGWTFVYSLSKPLLKPFGLNYLMVGVWFIGGTLIPFLIRRPGAALLGELLAAVVQGFITYWGLTSAIWGLAQGLGAELAFLLFGYRRFDLPVMVLAGLLAAAASYALDFFYSGYFGLAPWIWAVQIVSILASGAVWAGLAAWMIGRGIVRTGAAGGLRAGLDGN